MQPLINPRVTVIEQRNDGYSASYKHLFFVVSESVELDGKRWLHSSVSRNNKTLPTYEDLKTLKHLCIGDHRTALQVFPPATKHVNVAGGLGTEVLHLWSCQDGDVTPDFTRGGSTI